MVNDAGCIHARQFLVRPDSGAAAQQGIEGTVDVEWRRIAEHLRDLADRKVVPHGQQHALGGGKPGEAGLDGAIQVAPEELLVPPGARLVKVGDLTDVHGAGIDQPLPGIAFGLSG
jgi:hypothetical protein